MIDTRAFIEALRARGVSLFTGVPDSLLKEFSGCLMGMGASVRHVITANEGNAVGLAIGHYLATGRPAALYMQNSGLGNIVNPVCSLADPDVYGVPMLCIVGWRGEPGVKDEPQHAKQGRVTLAQLEAVEMPYMVLDGASDVHAALEEIWPKMLAHGGPVALVVRKNSLSPAGFTPNREPAGWPEGLAPLYREEAIKTIIGLLPEDACVVATTGKAGRELFELRQAAGQPQRDFLTVGGMGHASSIALGIALNRPQRQVVCLDGDGAFLMHMGAAAIIGNQACPNLLHVLLNNQAHESVGGQPTVAGSVDFRAIALACGYTSYGAARSGAEIRAALAELSGKPGPHFLEIHLWKGARKDLGRPTTPPQRTRLRSWSIWGACHDVAALQPRAGHRRARRAATAGRVCRKRPGQQPGSLRFGLWRVPKFVLPHQACRHRTSVRYRTVWVAGTVPCLIRDIRAILAGFKQCCTRCICSS